MINFFCSSCGQRLQTEDFKARRTVSCPTWTNPVMIPNQIGTIVQMIDDPPSQEPAFDGEE